MVTRVAAASQQLCANQCLRHSLPRAGVSPPAALHSHRIVTFPRHTWEEQVASPQQASKGEKDFFSQEDLRRRTDVAVAETKSRTLLHQDSCAALNHWSKALLMAGKRLRDP